VINPLAPSDARQDFAFLAAQLGRGSPLRMRARISPSSPRSSGGISSVIDLPIISAAA
jgi:hypothetical protein